MTSWTVTRTIAAPVTRVFETVSQIEHYSQAVPGIEKVEILSDTRSGVGTRFRETRKMGGHEATAVLEVTELVENERVRLVSDEGGTKWDSVFSVKAAGESTELTLVMEAEPYTVKAKMMAPLMKGMLSKALEKDMDAVKEHCEK